MWAALIGAALGAVKGKADARKHQDDKELAATTTRFSPWTGLKGQVTTPQGGAGQGMLKGGMAGYLGGKNQMKSMGAYENVLS